VLSRVQGLAHDAFVYQRRIRAVAAAFAPLLSEGFVLDVGCGNGELGLLLGSMREDVEVFGLEVVRRPAFSIPAVIYDGGHFPYQTDSFSCVVLADMLHHAEDPKQLLAEALRVGRDGIVIKDHFYRTGFDRLLLRILDWGGNAPHGVAMRYTYFSRESWEELLAQLPLLEAYRVEEVDGQYPGILQRWIGRKIQFVSKLVPR
jgi:SAM-dependent methyltransferase